MKKILAVTVSVLMVAMLVAGCGQKAQGKTLRIAIGEDVVSLDPNDVVDFNGLQIGYQVYERLIKYNEAKNTFEPMLAKSWEVSPDGLKWTFHLDGKAKFASGNPVTAEAMKYSLLRGIKQKMLPAWMLSQAITEDGLKAVDAQTLEITLAKPYAPLLAVLCSVAASAVDPQVIAQHETAGDMGKAWLKENSAGSGPFVVQSWERNSQIVLVRNAKYWREPAQLSQVAYLVVPEASSQAAMLEKGDIDVAQALLPEQVEALAAKGFVKNELPDTATYYLAMNQSFEPFKKKEVRQAVRYAIDYDGLIKGVLKGYAVEMGGILAPALLGYDPSLNIKQDIPKAKELMKQAGYPDGFKVTMHYQSAPIVGLGIPPENVAVKLQSDLAQIGIKIDPIKQDAATLLGPYREGKIPLAMWMWGPSYPDPDNIITSHGDKNHGGSKRLSYVNDQVTSLIEQARRTMDSATREQLYKQAQAIEADDGSWAWMFVTKKLVVTAPYVKNYRLINYWKADLYPVTIEK